MSAANNSQLQVATGKMDCNCGLTNTPVDGTLCIVNSVMGSDGFNGDPVELYVVPFLVSSSHGKTSIVKFFKKVLVVLSIVLKL